MSFSEVPFESTKELKSKYRKLKRNYLNLRSDYSKALTGLEENLENNKEIKSEIAFLKQKLEDFMGAFNYDQNEDQPLQAVPSFDYKSENKTPSMGSRKGSVKSNRSKSKGKSSML
ncbi:unnamed protein product [Moneuplotes crassus]|uniref:Uncharacterized protein n=1 Tax=Euplotes crassus TaxID=5936 RepID=A0AAD2D6L9_EUPCR|nr:unnamed protein product [Moneuplotes crassus]